MITIKSKFRLLVVLLASTYFTNSLALEEVLTDTGVKRVITVAPFGGDFRNPNFALDSISYTDENNQYVILIKPGTYYVGETLRLDKPYIDIVGSGKGTTKLLMANRTPVNSVISVESPRLQGNLPSNRIANLSIDNRSRNIAAKGIDVYNSVEIENVDVFVTGGSRDNFGMFIATSGVINVVNSRLTVSAFGNSSDTGVFVAATTSINWGLDNVTINVFGAPLDESSESTGFAVQVEEGSNFKCHNCTLTGRSGSAYIADRESTLELKHAILSSEPILYESVLTDQLPSALHCYGTRLHAPQPRTSVSGQRLTEECLLPVE